MEVLKQLLGRLHPIIVHLPIGFIIAALMLQWLDRGKKELSEVISRVFLWAAISAVLACITGYLQYLGEGYAFATVKTHLWFGIVTAIFAFVMYARLRQSLQIEFFRKISIGLLSVLVLVLIALTGHLGGSITHGEDYLVEPLPNRLKSALGFEVYEEQPIVLNEEIWQDAQLYEDVIAPILNNKCVSCHNKKRAKGDLLLNSKENILKGGENGEVISLSSLDESPLYARLILPEHHEDHMPPKDKPQPTKEEITLVKNWILAKAPFEGTIGELGMQKELFEPFFPKTSNEDYPEVEVAEAPIDSINKIKQQGIHIQPLSESSYFLSVSCINKPDFADKDFSYLLAVGEQIAALDLGGTQITDAIFEQMIRLPHLTILKIDNTAITGQQLGLLGQLEYLRVLNMTGTQFKKEHLSKFSSLHSLRSVYLFNTGLKATDNRENKADSTLTIEYGNYELPILASDSVIY